MSQMKLFRGFMTIPIIMGSIYFTSIKSYSGDLVFIKACFSDDEEVSKFGGECFMGTYDFFHSPLMILFFMLPFMILNDNGSDEAINTDKLTEMGYTNQEIADFAKDMNTLQNAMVQRNRKFTSASEAKAWMQTFPLTPITRELMRIQK